MHCALMQNKYTCIESAYYNDNSLDNLLKQFSLNNNKKVAMLWLKIKFR